MTDDAKCKTCGGAGYVQTGDTGTDCPKCRTHHPPTDDAKRIAEIDLCRYDLPCKQGCRGGLVHDPGWLDLSQGLGEPPHDDICNCVLGDFRIAIDIAKRQQAELAEQVQLCKDYERKVIEVTKDRDALAIHDLEMFVELERLRPVVEAARCPKCDAWFKLNLTRGAIADG